MDASTCRIPNTVTELRWLFIFIRSLSIYIHTHTIATKLMFQSVNSQINGKAKRFNQKKTRCIIETNIAHRTVVFSSISSSMVLVYLFGSSSICNDSNIPKFGVIIVIVLNRRILKVEEYMIKFSALTLFFFSIFYILCTSTAEVNQTTENKNCDTQTHHAILCLAIYSQYS